MKLSEIIDRKLVMTEAQRLRREYDNAHARCPECGSDKTSQTYVDYVLGLSNPEAYKDENKARCRCGWVGIVHDLKPV